MPNDDKLQPSPFGNDALDAAVNKFEAEASIDENRVGSAEVAFGRTWRNGWAVAAYARAWWEGGSVVNSEAGVKVSKTF